MTRINKSLADCAALIMKDGDIVNYRSPLSILIYDYYALANGLEKPASAARKQRAVISALGKDARFDAVFMVGCNQPSFVLKACKKKNLIYN